MYTGSTDAKQACLSIIGWGMYNVYFHPLRRYPGPKLWAAYRLPYVVRNFQGVLPFKVLEFHKQYGPVVRIAPDELAYTDPEAWNDIYGMQPGRVQNAKDKSAYTPLQPGGDATTLCQDAVALRLPPRGRRDRLVRRVEGIRGLGQGQSESLLEAGQRSNDEQASKATCTRASIAYQV